MASPGPNELIQIDYAPPAPGWIETGAGFRPGTYSHGARAKNLAALELPNPRAWQTFDRIGNCRLTGSASFSTG